MKIQSKVPIISQTDREVDKISFRCYLIGINLKMRTFVQGSGMFYLIYKYWNRLKIPLIILLKKFNSLKMIMNLRSQQWNNSYRSPTVTR
jgi:hypothetical protein